MIIQNCSGYHFDVMLVREPVIILTFLCPEYIAGLLALLQCTWSKYKPVNGAYGLCIDVEQHQNITINRFEGGTIKFCTREAKNQADKLRKIALQIYGDRDKDETNLLLNDIIEVKNDMMKLNETKVKKPNSYFTG